MDILRSGTRPTKKASSEYFTGTVWQGPIVAAPEPARVRAIRVTFEPAASRTAWHTHPLGQTLYVLSGTGLVGLRGEPPKIINAGDTVWIPPHEEHWHGATATNSMCHLAIQESHEGHVAEWLEKVSDDDYKLPTLPLKKCLVRYFSRVIPPNSHYQPLTTKTFIKTTGFATAVT